jgi:hypothetical protein
MCKAMDKSIAIREIVLVRKSGGKSGGYTRVGTADPFTALRFGRDDKL